MSSGTRTRLNKIKKPPQEATAWCYTGCQDDVNFNFAWTIENFSRKMETYENGNHLASDTFVFEVEEGVETSWKLIVYPNGEKRDDMETSGCVSMYLQPNNLAALNRDVRLTVELVNGKESLSHKIEFYCNFSIVHSQKGWPHLFAHSKLKSEDRKLLPGDRLNVFCNLKCFGSEVTTSGKSKPTSIPQRLPLVNEEDRSGLLEMLQTGYLSDVDVVCEGQNFPCHRVILASKSPVFRAFFEHNMKEKATGKIIIKNLERDIVVDMLTHIYGGEIDGMEAKVDKLLAAADQYDLKKLKELCENMLAGRLNINNCLEYLILADLHSAKKLKTLVTRFVVENSREVVTQDQWKEKLIAYPEVFAEVFNEVVIFAQISRGVFTSWCSAAQEFHQVRKFDKREKLLEILSSHPVEQTLVFVEEDRHADFLGTFMNLEGIASRSIHGDMTSREVREALFDFNAGTHPNLMITDLAARGLDFSRVMHVVNYDMPADVSEYVLRTGLTLRFGNKGKVTSFFDVENDAHMASPLLEMMEENGIPIPDWLADIAEYTGSM